MRNNFLIVSVFAVCAVVFVSYEYVNYIKKAHDEQIAIECSQAAKKWHDSQNQYVLSTQAQIDPYYVSHYSMRDGQCYATVLEDWKNTSLGTAGLLYSGFLYSVYENKMVLEDETGLNGKDTYAKYTLDAASSTEISEQEYNALYKFYLSD